MFSVMPLIMPVTVVITHTVLGSCCYPAAIVQLKPGIIRYILLSNEVLMVILMLFMGSFSHLRLLRWQFSVGLTFKVLWRAYDIMSCLITSLTDNVFIVWLPAMTRREKHWRRYQYFLPPLYESIHPYSSVKIRCWRDIMLWMELWEARLLSGNIAQKS